MVIMEDDRLTGVKGKQGLGPLLLGDMDKWPHCIFCVYVCVNTL